MRPIDADELRKKAEMRGHLSKNPMVTVHYMCVDVVEIDNAPTLDVEPVRRGKWIVEERPFSIWAGMRFIREDTRKTYTCDQCGIGIVGLDDMNYCPNCGAKMEVE